MKITLASLVLLLALSPIFLFGDPLDPFLSGRSYDSGSLTGASGILPNLQAGNAPDSEAALLKWTRERKTNSRPHADPELTPEPASALLLGAALTALAVFGLRARRNAG